MAEQILVVAGEPVVRSTVARILSREGFTVHLAENAEEAASMCDRLRDLAVVVAGSASALEVVERVKATHPRIRSVMIAEALSEEASGQARRLGVDGLLEQPFEMAGLLETIAQLSASLQAERDRNAMLERLRANVVTMVDSLARALEDRDPYTAGHSLRVAEYSVMIGSALGLSDFHLELLRHGAALHDIGKIAVRQDVLHKPGRLTDDEYEHIKMHPVVGREILEPIEDFKEMLDLVYYHHERIDGRGYPEGLAGDEIPLLAQIVAVADTYDAMTSDRPYRSGMPPEKAFAIMNEVSGTQLNAELVTLLARRIRASTGTGHVADATVTH